MSALAEKAATPARPEVISLRVTLAGLMAVMALAVIETNIVNTSLPRIVADLGGMSRLAWVVTAFLLTSTIAAPLYGKLSDLYGRRRMLVVSIATFLAGSLLCGAAQSMTQMILFRGLQGLGAGGLVTLVQATIGHLVSPDKRARYQTLFTVVFALSSLAGPLIGGALTTYVSWRWIFLVNLPVGLVALMLILNGLPPSDGARRSAIDLAGAALLATCTTSLLVFLGSSPQRSLLTYALLGVATALSFSLLLRQERRASEPILDLDLFGNRTFAIGICATTAMSFAMLAALLLLPLYLQLIAGRSPMQAAMIVTPQIVGMILSSAGGARFATSAGRVPLLLVAGVILEALGLWGLVVGTGLGLPIWAFSIIAMILGMGMGMGMPNAVAIVQNAVGRHQLGVATGAVSFFRSLGGAAGVALSGGVVALDLRRALVGQHFDIGVQTLIDRGGDVAGRLPPDQLHEFLDAYRHAIEAGFVLCALVISVALVPVLLLPNAVRRADGLKVTPAGSFAETAS